jgi:hypothetical protein
MTLIRRFILMTLLLGGFAGSAWAQNATQDVTVVVQEINAISVSGNVTLTISGATAGSSPTDATNAASSYSLTTNGTSKKITAALDEAYASGITLKVALTAPTASGSSAGEKTLGTSAVDVVTAVSNVAEGGLQISYTASATPGAAPNAGGGGETKTVTYTVTGS